MALHKDIYATRRWQRLRLQVLVKHPLCECCGRPSSQVHHVESIEERPDLAFDEGNLMSLCAACHSRLFTAAEVAMRKGRVFRRKGCDVDGQPLGGWLC